MRHRRAPWRRRTPYYRPIVADAIKDRIVQPSRQRLHRLPRRPRAVGVNNSARRNLLLLPQLPRRRRANGVSSARHNPHKPRHLHPLLCRHRRLRANNAGNGLSVHRNRRKLRRLHPPRHSHRRLRADNGSNGLSVHRNRHELRRLRPLLRQRRRQNRPIPISAKNRTATGKTIGPIRPDPIPNQGGECSSAAFRLKIGGAGHGARQSGAKQ